MPTSMADVLAKRAAYRDNHGHLPKYLLLGWADETDLLVATYGEYDIGRRAEWASETPTTCKRLTRLYDMEVVLADTERLLEVGV